MAVPLEVLLAIIGVSAVASWLATPVMRWIAVNTALFDMPDVRKVHATPTPLLGGGALYGGFVIGVGTTLIWNGQARTLLHGMWPWLLVACTIVIIAGLWDDVRHWSAWWKLGWQVAVAALLWWRGIRMEVITNPLHGTAFTLPPWVSCLVTVLWIVSLINAINLIDGLDGLAVGTSTIVALFLLSIACRLGNVKSAYLLAGVVGTCVGFLPYNWPPAKIFMGDAGSQLLGLLLAVAPLVEFQYKAATTVALLIPLTTLAIPISDVALSIVRRLQGHRSIFRADKQHLHHRLLELGLSPRQVVVLLYLVTAYLGIIATLFVIIPEQHAMILVVLLGLGLFMGMRTMGFIERRLRYVYLREAKRRRMDQ